MGWDHVSRTTWGFFFLALIVFFFFFLFLTFSLVGWISNSQFFIFIIIINSVSIPRFKSALPGPTGFGEKCGHFPFLFFSISFFFNLKFKSSLFLSPLLGFTSYLIHTGSKSFIYSFSFSLFPFLFLGKKKKEIRCLC